MASKGTFVQISRAMWKHRHFRDVVQCGPEASLLAWYLMTAPNGNMSGVFECTPHDISKFTGLSLDCIGLAFDKLDDVGFCEYSPESEYVWDKGAISRHFGMTPSEKQIIGVINVFVRLYEEEAPFICEAFEKFKEDYPQWAGLISERIEDLGFIWR